MIDNYVNPLGMSEMIFYNENFLTTCMDMLLIKHSDRELLSNFDVVPNGFP